MHEHPKHPMNAHAYDQMLAAGYDMSEWERIAPPPGQPQYKVRHFTNRAERRAEERARRRR